MRRPLLALAAVLFSGVAVPALADWDRIGTVDFSFRNDRETQYGNFGGSVEALALRARDASVTCRNVSATFGNGQVRTVFTGTLPRGRLVTVDLPGADRNIRRLDFNCRSTARAGSAVDISADIGRYRAEWRRSPNWNTVWSRMFGWANDVADNGVRDHSNMDAPRGWRTLGTASFEGRRDRETKLPGWRGRDIERIGLRAVNDDAQCRDVVVTFNNGRSRTLVSGTRLTEDRIREIDLPGGDRNVTSVSMNCHAEHGRQVAVQVLGRDLDGRVGYNR
jgi:hypothetical protein